MWVKCDVKASPETCPFQFLNKWKLFMHTHMSIHSLTFTKTESFIDSAVMRGVEEMLLSLLLRWRNKLYSQITIKFPR